MELFSKILWILGSVIILLLGTAHLFYTFFTSKLFPRNNALAGEMKEGHPQLTKATTIWKAWIGFNGSHSTGAMFFGILNIYLAATNFQLIRSDVFIIVIDLLMCGSYCWLAWKYWFKIPLIGILITTICYILASLIFLFS